jgi:hypothetical protein
VLNQQYNGAAVINLNYVLVAGFQAGLCICCSVWQDYVSFATFRQDYASVAGLKGQ